jgi:hypothetical protein
VLRHIEVVRDLADGAKGVRSLVQGSAPCCRG